MPDEVKMPESRGYHWTLVHEWLCPCRFCLPTCATFAHVYCGRPLQLARSCTAMAPSAAPDSKLHNTRHTFYNEPNGHRRFTEYQAVQYTTVFLLLATSKYVLTHVTICILHKTHIKYKQNKSNLHQSALIHNSNNLLSTLSQIDIKRVDTGPVNSFQLNILAQLVASNTRL